MHRIDSPENQTIKLASSLKQRKYREKFGLMVVEGQRSVQEVMARPELLQKILVDESLADQFHVPDLPSHIETCLLKPGLLKRISATENPPGIAALVKIPVWSWDNILKSRLLLLLDRIADPGNMGSILRTSWAMGVDAILLTRGCADPYSPKVVRSSMGAVLNVPVFADVSGEQLDSLAECGFRFICTDVEKGQRYYKIRYQQPSILVLGSEADGVSEEIKSRCNDCINIPLQSGVDSLNVAAACAIIVAEAWRQQIESMAE